MTCLGHEKGRLMAALENVLVKLLSGAGNRVRTGDPQLGKLMLYQLSYSRSINACELYSPGSPLCKAPLRS